MSQSAPLEVWTASLSLTVVKLSFERMSCVQNIPTNLLGVRVFGELELRTSSLGVLSLAGFILLGAVIDLGGNPLHDRIGFRCWRPPQRPCGTLTTALHRSRRRQGGETNNPGMGVPRAIKRTFVRKFIFYIGTVPAMSWIVP
ncbi:hypothetical protein HD554DRAFT_1117336 [Boletus coccyginus]|nr:hypothetical protein HD554DRAFT_1117336 [Boletus coccyginus]